MIGMRHLRYFIAVAEDLSFRCAAERIHIDQRLLSRAIRDLEDELDIQLLLRSPGRSNPLRYPRWRWPLASACCARRWGRR